MGYLTTITFRNDSYSEFENHPKKLVEEILKALNGIQINRGFDYFSIGSDANPVILQKPRHADDNTLYLHSGNTIVDINGITEKTDRNEWVINQAISEMEYQLKRLKKLKNNGITETF